MRCKIALTTTALVIVAVVTSMTYQSVDAGSTTDLSAKRHSYRAASDANGNGACHVTSKKTGATTRVGCPYVGKFQAYIDDLEANGAVVHDIGGIRPGHCSSAHQHPCGKAIDVCQLRRGVVSGRCHLPGRARMAEIAAAHGLFEGGRWCNSDYGHAQVDVSAGDCHGGTMVARNHTRTRIAMSAKRHRHTRYAMVQRVQYEPVPAWNRP